MLFNVDPGQNTKVRPRSDPWPRPESEMIRLVICMAIPIRKLVAMLMTRNFCRLLCFPCAMISSPAGQDDYMNKILRF